MHLSSWQSFSCQVLGARHPALAARHRALPVALPLCCRHVHLRQRLPPASRCPHPHQCHLLTLPLDLLLRGLHPNLRHPPRPPLPHWPHHLRPLLPAAFRTLPRAPCHLQAGCVMAAPPPQVAGNPAARPQICPTHPAAATADSTNCPSTPMTTSLHTHIPEKDVKQPITGSMVQDMTCWSRWHACQ